SDGELHRGHPGVAKEAVTLSVQVYRRSSRGWANVGPSGKTLLRRALHQGCRVHRVGTMGNTTSFPHGDHHLPTTSTPHNPRCASGCQQLLSGRVNSFPELTIALQLRLNLVDGMDNCRVVAAAERLADLHKLHLQQLAREEHRDL